MQRYPILVLVGPSGGGKTSLLLSMLDRYPGRCAAIKSKTTRARREPQDDIFYDFVTPEQFTELELSGRLFQTANFGGNRYGCDREQTDATVADKLGLVVLVQQSVADFVNAGYKLHLVKIDPQGYTPRSEAQRLRDDQARAQIELTYDNVIVNSFAPGGFERAQNELANIVDRLLNQSHPNA